MLWVSSFGSRSCGILYMYVNVAIDCCIVRWGIVGGTCLYLMKFLQDGWLCAPDWSAEAEGSCRQGQQWCIADISQRHLAQLEARRQESRLDALADRLPLHYPNCHASGVCNAVAMHAGLLELARRSLCCQAFDDLLFATGSLRFCCRLASVVWPVHSQLR